MTDRHEALAATAIRAAHMSSPITPDGMCTVLHAYLHTIYTSASFAALRAVPFLAWAEHIAGSRSSDSTTRERAAWAAGRALTRWAPEALQHAINAVVATATADIGRAPTVERAHDLSEGAQRLCGALAESRTRLVVDPCERTARGAQDAARHCLAAYSSAGDAVRLAIEAVDHALSASDAVGVAGAAHAVDCAARAAHAAVVTSSGEHYSERRALPHAQAVESAVLRSALEDLAIMLLIGAPT